MHYFFLEEEPLVSGAEVNLDSRDINHALKVLRLKQGDKLVVADGCGLAREGEVIIAVPKKISVKLGIKIPGSESSLKITLFQALTKGDKMDLIIRQAVELGINRIIPFKSKRSIPQRNEKQDQKKIERWNGIVRSAAAQCRRAYLPIVESVHAFEQIFPRIGNTPVLIPWEKAKTVSLTSILKQPCPTGKAVIVFIGPEGGFEKIEIEALQKVGADVVHLGPRILRTETAATAAITMVQSAWGDLAGEGVNT